MLATELLSHCWLLKEPFVRWLIQLKVNLLSVLPFLSPSNLLSSRSSQIPVPPLCGLHRLASSSNTLEILLVFEKISWQTPPATLKKPVMLHLVSVELQSWSTVLGHFLQFTSFKRDVRNILASSLSPPYNVKVGC